MANSYSTLDVVKGALQRAGEVTNGNSPYHAAALKYVNQVHKEIIKGNSLFGPDVREAWTWARQTKSFQILPYVTGSVSLTANSTAATFTAAPTMSVQGYDFQVIGYPTFYSVSAHTANQAAATLDFNFIDGVTGTYTYNALPLIVDLGARIQRLVSPMRIYVKRVLELGEVSMDMGRLMGIDSDDFWRDYPLQFLMNDTPTRFTTISATETSWKIRLNKYSSVSLRVDYDYIPVPTDLTLDSSSLPLLRADDRAILECGAAYYLFLDKKQPQDAQNMQAMTSAMLQALVANERSSTKFYDPNYGQLIPRRDDTAFPYWLVSK